MINFEKGFALYFLLLFIVATGIFVSTIFNGIIIDMRLVENIVGHKKAYYAADAGIDYGRYIIKLNNEPAYSVYTSSLDSFLDFQKRIIPGGGIFKIKIKKKEKENYFKIIVEGYFSKNNCEIEAIVNKEGDLINYKIIR